MSGQGNDKPLDLTNEPISQSKPVKKIKYLNPSNIKIIKPNGATEPTKSPVNLVQASTSSQPPASASSKVQVPVNTKKESVPLIKIKKPFVRTVEPMTLSTDKLGITIIKNSKQGNNAAVERPSFKKKTTLMESHGTNPLQRGKYGLRPLPQQVDYYQSILEEKKAKSQRQALKTDFGVDSISDGDKSLTTVTKDLGGDIHVKRRTSDSLMSPKKLKIVESKDHRSPKTFSEQFSVGDVVWATLPTYKTWFPALIISHIHCGQKPSRSGHTWVYWFGDHQVSEIPKVKVKAFIQHFGELSKGTSALTSTRMKESLRVLASRAGVSFPSDTPNSEDEALISWAKDGFQVQKESRKADVFAPDPSNPIPAEAAIYLPLDPLYQESFKTDDRMQQIAFYEVESAEKEDEPVHISEFKVSQVEKVRKGEIKLDAICIACCCDYNPNADSINGEKCIHPYFEGILCKQCRENIKATMYAPGDDNKNSFCAVCGQVGRLAICDNDNCHRVFCFVCLDLYIGEGTPSKLLEEGQWHCYICKEYPEGKTNLLKTRNNWRENVKSFYDPIRPYIFRTPISATKGTMKVLSLFDGIGATRLAMEKLGLDVETYYASETDKDAISVAKYHFGESIAYIENLENITVENILPICPIDLVIGGFHSKELSNASRKGLFDTKGSGHFLYFNHILQLVRLANKEHPVFFLFENSASIPSAHRDIISNLLMTKPVTLNTREFSSQVPSRYFWSNIPGINRPLPPDVQKNYISLTSALVSSSPKRTQSEQMPTNLNKGNTFKSIEESTGSMSPNELEKLLGFEEGFTDINGLSKTKRQNLLGKTWCLPVTCHILWALKDFFKSK